MIYAKASYGRRILSWFVDLLCLSLVTAAVVTPGVILLFVDGVRGFGVAILIISPIFVIGFSLWNSVFRQGRTGQTLGKSVMSLKLISTDDGSSTGAGQAFLRLLVAWALNAVTGGIFFFVDSLFPLFDKQGQRVVDKIMKTQVTPMSSPTISASIATSVTATSDDLYG